MLTEKTVSWLWLRALRTLKCAWVGVALVATPTQGALAVSNKVVLGADRAEVLRLRVPRPEVFRLDNGLRVLLQRVAREPIVATVMSYEVGSRDDPPGYEGLAHLVEHLSYTESWHLPRYGIISALVGAGAASWNGATFSDHTVYHSVLGASRVALPLWLESERMAFTLEYIDQRALDHERGIVQTELLGKFSRQWLHLQRTLYPEGHPYSSPAEPAATLADIDLGAVQGHFQRAYRPDNATLVIVGQIDPARVREHVTRYFAPVQNPPSKLKRRTAPPRVFPGRETLTVEQRIFGRRLSMVWPAPPAASQERLAFEFLFRLLAGSRSGSLSSRLVDELGLASDVDFEINWNDLDSTLIINSELNPGALFEPVERAIEQHLGALAHMALSARELARLRAVATTELLSKFEDVLERANLHLTSLRHSGRTFSLTEAIARVGATDAATFARVARRYLDPNHRLSARFDEAKVWVPPNGRASYSVERLP